MIFRDGGAGRLYWASKTARSALIVGDPNESTITMVWPAPVIPALNRGCSLSAVCSWSGPSQGAGHIASHWAWVPGCRAEMNLLCSIGPIAMLAVAGRPPATRDPVTRASAPAIRMYRRDRCGKETSPVQTWQQCARVTYG